MLAEERRILRFLPVYSMLRVSLPTIDCRPFSEPNPKRAISLPLGDEQHDIALNLMKGYV